MVSRVRLPDGSPAPLAQLVEQLTLNQWVRGSSPGRCTKRVGVFIVQGPPVPIPNTEVKLYGAENTYMETCREDRTTPTSAMAIACAEEDDSKPGNRQGNA